MLLGCQNDQMGRYPSAEAVCRAGSISHRKHPHATWTPGMPNHLRRPTHLFLDPSPPGSRVGTVDPDFLHARKLPFDRFQQELDALANLEIGGMDHHFEQQSHRIDEQVAFASRQLFRSVIAMRASPLRCFDRLAVKNTTTGGSLARFLQAQSLAKRLHDAFPDAL